MATNQENIALDQVQDIVLDQYSSPIFNPALQKQVGISKGYNYLDAPSNLDRIQVELIDQYDNTVESKEFHISEIDGIKYDGGRLLVDTFSILTQEFNKTTGQYNIRVSGFRKYIYNDLTGDGTQLNEVVPSDIAFASLEVMEVSRTRKEVRVKANNSAFAAFENFYQTQTVNTIPHISPLLPNGKESDTDIWPALLRVLKVDGSPLDLVSTNWIHHEHVPNKTEGAVEGDVKEIDTVIFKLATAAPSNIRPGTKLQILRPLFVPYNIPVEIDIPYFVDEVFNDLRGPNFRIDTSIATSKATILKSEEDLIGTTAGIKSRLHKSAVSGSGLIKTNCDYRQYKNFVHFSSAEERLKNFKYKLVQIEHYESKSAAISTGFGGSDVSVTGSQTILANKLKYDNLANGFISSFNPYEQYLYYTSHSAETVYTSEGVETLSPATWPKSPNGVELIKNGDFTSLDNHWTLGTGWSVVVGGANWSSTAASGNNAITQAQTFTSGKTYQLSFTISNRVIEAKLDPRLWKSGPAFDAFHSGYVDYAAGNHVLYITADSDYTHLQINAEDSDTPSPTSFTLSNVSVKEVASDGLSAKTGTGYNLYSTTSPEATSWYAGQLVSASEWDQQNPSALRNVIPTHIRVDSEQASYQLFFDMIGEHFDEVYLQIKSLEESHARDESVDVGLSKDLLFDTAKSFGWNLHSGYSTSELWEYVLGTSNEGVYQSSGSGETLTYVVKESHPSGDIEKQTWKRILNNLPLLLKTKGTARGVKSLLSAYGIPLTILNIDEYGGAPTTRGDDKRAIEKFVYAINMSGSSQIMTNHATFASTTQPTLNNLGSTWSLTNTSVYPRVPSMYEVRIDTTVTQSMYIARGHNPTDGLTSWDVRLEHSSSAAGWDSPSAIAAGSASTYANYGRLVFEISSSDGKPAISASTSYEPFFDNDWWNISFGVTETPYTKAQIALLPATQTFVVRYAKAAEHSNGKITHSGSATVTGNSSSYSHVWSDDANNLKQTIWSARSTTDTPAPYQSFSGSMQEIRAWAEYLSDDTFHQHTLAPTSVVGNTVEMAYNDLLLRLPLGTDVKTYNHSTITTITSSIPNLNNRKWGYLGQGEGGLLSGFSGNPYSAKSETYFVKVPHTAGPSKHSNKIRIEDNTLQNNQLSRDTSFEVSSFNSNPVDSEDVSVVLSPADQIDTDISMQFGGFDLDDYIGDPRDTYKTEYTSLRNTKNLYFKKYSEGNSTVAFIRFLRSFNKGLFKQIENMIPARADAVVGIEIRPNILERHKLTQPISASRETMYHTGSITVRTAGDMDGSVPSAETLNSSDYGTHVGQIGIGAPPSRQRSGSNDYYNLYEGSKYLRDVFGETTESAVQQLVLDVRNLNENRVQIPTYNTLSKPAYGVNKTGSGWITVFEDNFTSFASHSNNVGIASGHIYGSNDVSDTWRIIGNATQSSVTIVGDGLQIGNNLHNDQAWLQWNNPFSYQPNTLYRMSITVSCSLDTDNDARVYAGFGLFSSDGQTGDDIIQVSADTGNTGNGASQYFVASFLNIAATHGLGVDVTKVGVLGNSKNSGPNTFNQNTSANTAMSKFIQTKTPTQGLNAEKLITHFTPMFIVNYSGDDATTRITHLKVEALPGAFVNASPQYDSSPAQRRLVIDGTKMTSPDWNIGSTSTIDGGPVAEYQLVNPNIVTVALGPDNAPVGGQPYLSPFEQAQNQNITVR